MINIAVAERDLFEARDLLSLPILDRRNELRRFEQRLRGAGVKPGVSAAENFDFNQAPSQVFVLDVCNLQFAARASIMI